MRSPRSRASPTITAPSTTWRRQPLAGGEVGVGDAPRIGRLGDGVGHLGVVVPRDEAPDARQRRFEPLAELLRLDEVGDADSATSDLVDVGRTDAARGRADPRRAALPLVELVEHDVVRHHQVGAVADRQVVRRDPGRGEPVELRDEGRRIDDHPGAEEVPGGRVEDPRWDEVELEVAVRVHDGVAGVVAAAVPHDQVGIGGEVVDDATLALVTPLRPDDGDHGHGRRGTSSAAGRPS